ncbi:hypothetical protein IFR05_016777 [Cadophora sp. M221]|nr:hypothetical protein IFR05_016777 [Cadophora sp. M221]
MLLYYSRWYTNYSANPSRLELFNLSILDLAESQEKRRRTMEPVSDSLANDSKMETTPQNLNRRTERELQIQKELSKVKLRKRTLSTNPRSSAPTSSTVGVEVPSIGRRRSFQDGHDARDTQDDVIVDSQATKIEAPELEQYDSSKQEEKDVKPSLSEPVKAAEVEDQTDAEATQNTNSSNPKPIPEPDLEPSLPLQEMSSNRGVRTPSSKL